MITVEHEYYIRFILLLLQVGTDLLREIMDKALKKRQETLPQFLNSSQNAILHDRKLTRIQKDTLYPSNPQGASIEDFDITLLSHLIKNYLNKDIVQLEMDATNDIQQLRNKYHAHTTEAKMDAITYNKEWTKLVTNIIKVDTGMSSEVSNRHANMVDHIGNDSIDIMALLNEIKSLDRSRDFYESIQHSLVSVQTDLQDIKTTVQNTAGAVAAVDTNVSETKAVAMATKAEVMQMKDMIIELKQQRENQGRITKIVQTMYGKVYLGADDQETVNQAEADLLEASNNSVAKKEPTDKSHQALQEKVDLVVKDFENLDVKVEGVRKGSIIFEFKCQSLTAILDLIDYFYSSKFQRRLDDIAQALEDITGKNIYITANGIDKLSIKNVISKLQKKEYEKVVQFELSCDGLDGLLHILEVFEEGKATNSMNELSKALSDKVGKPVTLHTSIDMDQMKNAIQTIKDQLEGGIREIESGGDEIFDLCEAKSKNTQADNFCLECHDYYSSYCVKCHDYSPELKDHTIMPHSQVKSTAQLPEGIKMATGGISDIERGGDEMFDFLCSVCKEQNKYTEADKFCYECYDYYCSSCIKCHENNPALKDHKILAGSTTQLPAVPTEKCKVHTHEPVDMYCMNHDVVGCSDCMLMTHSSCNKTVYVPDYVKDTSEAENLKDIEEEFDNVTKFLNGLHEEFIREKESLKDSKDISLKDIGKFRQKINQLLDQFEEKTVKELEHKFQGQVDIINIKLKELQASTAEVKAARERVKSAESAKGNIPQIFVSIKQASEVISQARKQINITKSQFSHTEMYFLVNEKLQALLGEINVLGSIRLIKKIQIVGNKGYPVNLKSDSRACTITSACELVNGTIILADGYNSKLKRIESSSYKVTNCCAVPEQPGQVCAITDKEVAVSCRDSALLQFVKVGKKMKKTRQIKTGFNCRGLAYANEILFVSDVTSVYMFSLTGEKLQQLYNDQSLQRLFSDITALAVNSDLSRIYVTCLDKGLITLDMNCQLVGQYNGDKLRSATGICIDNNDNVFVSGSSSKNVLQFCPDGKLINEILKTDISCMAVCCNKHTSELIVGFCKENYIRVYNISED